MSDGVFGDPKPATAWPPVRALELAHRLSRRVVKLEDRLEKVRDRVKALEGSKSLAKAHAADELKALRKALAGALRRLEALEARLAALEGRPVAKAAGPQGRDPLLAKAQALGAGELMGLLSRVITEPARVAVAEHYANRGDLAAALSVLTLEERAEVARVLQAL
jgi:BMFP domain-containing protein YqiC